jgi:flagellar hook-basal body complex protein FliE
MPITSGAGAYAATQRLLSTGGQTGGLSGGLAGAVGGGDFSAMLERAVGSVAESGRKAEVQAMAAASGKADLVDVVTAVAESETALQTLVAVRDKVISAYEEIMRMPI